MTQLNYSKTIFHTWKNAMCLIALMLLTIVSANAQLVNIPVTGFTNDLVANGTGDGTNGTTVNTATTGNMNGMVTQPAIGVDGVGYTFIDATYKWWTGSVAPACFMPTGGAIQSAITPGLTYQLQSYSAANAMTITSNTYAGSVWPTTGSVSLVTPASYTNLYVLYETVMNTAGPTVTATVTFTDATTQVFSANAVVNWFTATSVAYTPSISRAQNVAAGAANACGTGPYLFQFNLAISPANYAKLVQSISFNWSAATGAAANTVDYLHVLALGGLTPCAGTPTPGNTLSTANPACPSVNFTLSTQNGTGGGATYQWQSSPDGVTWTDIAGATSPTRVASQIVDTYYQCVVTCGANIGTSTPIQVTMATPLNGTYTVNSGAITGGTNFQTFTALKDILNCAGVSGPVIVNVVAATGPYTEQIQFNVIPGASAVNTITINGNGNTLTFGATLSTAPGTLVLNGTDYMTVNNLTVAGTGGTYALVCHLYNQADNNTFSGCTFNAPANGTSTTQVPFSISGSATSATTSGVSGNNNIVTGCTMFSGYYNTCFVGNSAGANTGNQLLNCNIRDQYFYATYILYQNGMIISGNTMDRLTRTTLSTYYGLYISTGCTNVLSEKNKIRNTYATNTASTGTQYSIYCTIDATLGNENKFYNNVVSDINFNGTIYGMYMLGSDYWKAYHNTISLDQTAASGTTTTYGIYATGTLAKDVRNNIVTISRGGTGTKYCVYYTTPAVTTSNNNNLYMNSVAGTNYVGYNGTNYATLALWQAGSGKDASSVSLNPAYVSPGTYDYTPTVSPLNDIGAALGILTDITGAARSASTPDPGAYEFSVGPCAGTPAPGNTLASSNPACASSTLTLSLQNFTLGSGVTYQWQTSPDGITWTNAGGATSSTYSLSQTVATYYQCLVTCSTGPNTGTSTAVLVNQNPVSACYCTPTTTGGGTYYISNFTTTGGTTNINNTSASATGYTNFFATVGMSAVQNTSVNWTMTIAGGSTYGKAIWVDWNQDGAFSAGEQVASSTAYASSPFTGSFTVPLTATAGTTRMRMVASFTPANPSDPCAISGSGEFEDYAFTVIATSVCSGTPTPGNTLSTATNACVGVPFTLSLQNTPTSSGITYQWQSSPDGTTWTNLSGATSSTYVVSSQTTATYYYCLVTCTTGPNSAFSSSLLVGQNAPSQCYCTPTTTGGTTYYISNFTTTGGTTNINNTSAGSATGYQNFSSTATMSAVPNSVVNFTMTIAGGSTYGKAIWIDYNQDGTFAAGEQVASSTGYVTSPISGSFTVPLTATTGATRMRIIASFTPSNPSNPCTNTGTGEYEDYAFTVVAYPATPPNPVEVGTPVCATGGNIAAVGSAPSGETWYWQATAAGTSIATPVSGNYNIPANGTYYIRSRDNTNLLWSTGAGSITVSDFPPGPAAPTITTPGGNPTCSTVSLVSSTATAGTTNYWQGTNALGLSTSQIADDGTTNTPLVVSTSGTYYLNSKDNSSGCWSVISSQVVTIYGSMSGSVTATQILSCVNPTGLITASVNGAGTVVNNDFTSSTLPSYMTLQGSASITGGELVITPTSAGQSGSVLVQNTTGLANNDFQIDFDFITKGPAGIPFGGTAADGLSYSYGDDVVAGTYQNVTNGSTSIGYPSNSPVGNVAEGGSGTKLKISFDPWANGVGTLSGINGGTNYAGIYFMYNCTDYFNAVQSPTGATANDNARGVLSFSPATWWRATNTQPATPVNTTHVTIVMAGAEVGYPNGSTTLTLTGTTGLAQGNVFGPVKVALPAGYLTADKSTWKHVFAARTGGNWEGHAIDNLNIKYNNFYEYSINGGTSWSQTNPIVPPTSGTYSVDARYVSVPGCSANLGSVTITAPSFTTSSTATTICSGSSTSPTISFSPTFGAGATYQWQSSPAGAGIWTNVVGATAVTYTAPSGTITSDTDFRCEISCAGVPIPGSPSSTVTITTNPVPALTVSPTTASICSPGGTAATLTASGDPATYAWTPTTGLNVSTGASVNALPSATTTYTVTATSGVGCTSTATSTITVIPGPTVTVTAAPSSVCSGSNTQLLATTNAASASYDWSTNSTFLSSTNIANPVAQAVTSAQTYAVSVTDQGSGCVNTQNVSITVNEIPDPTANSNSPICEGVTLSLTGDNIASGQTTNNTFSWTGPNLYTSAQQNPTVTSTATVLESGTYTVVVTNQYLCTASMSTIVTVNPNPAVSTASTTDVSCVGLCDGSATINASGATPDYLFTDGSNFIVGTSSGTFSNLLCEGSTTITVYDNFGCASDIVVTLGHISSVPPSASVLVPPINNLPASACNGTVVNNINVPSVALATQYIWDGPTGTTFNGSGNPYTSTTPSANITFGNPNGSGYYIGIQAANGCGTSTRKVQWVRGIVSVPAAITGATTACPNASGTYTTGAVTGATQYLWTVTGDATVSGTGTTATVNFGPTFTTGSLCVQAQTSCFTSAPKCISITNAASTITQIVGTFIACPGQTLTYSVAPVSGAASYAWTLPPGATGSSTTNSINVTFGAGFSGGNIAVQVTSTCGILSPVKSKTINSGVPPTPGSITGPLTGLCGQTIVYTCPSQSGVTFTWTVPAGATINSGQGTNAVSVTFGTFGTSTVCVTAGTSCGASTARCITVKGAPNAPGAITAIPSSWCANTAGVEFDVDVSALTGSYTLSWLYPGPTVATYVLGGGNSTSLIMNWLTGSGPVNVTASNACGNATRTSTQASSCRQAEEVLTSASSINTINVYPNPTSGNISVEFNSMTKGNANVAVQDISGRTITAQDINVIEGLNQTQLDLTKVAKGIYMINVNSNETTGKVKIVVE